MKIRYFALILIFALGFYAYQSPAAQKSIVDSFLLIEESLSNLERHTITIADQTIYYLDNHNSNAKETILLIHGFGADTSNWIRFSRALSDDYRIIIPDLPGHGKSNKDLNGDYRLELQAERMNILMQTLGLTQYHAIGNSMGGAITGLMAYQFPQQVKSAAFMNSAGLKIHPAEVNAFLKEGGKFPLLPQTRKDFDELLNFAMNKPPFMPWPFKNVKAAESIADYELRNMIFKKVILTDDLMTLEGKLQSMTQPTLVLWGDKDRLLDVKNADEFMNRLPNAQKVILNDIGHAPMIEVPKESAKLYREFLKENGF